jgi:NlpC/P60 family putative phage cell wall peptidase
VIRADIVSCARSWIGTPYHDQASVKGVGVDCLGLARGIWRELIGPEPLAVPPYSRDWGEVQAREVLREGIAQWLEPIALADLQPGSVVLFRMIPRAIAKHVGIITAPGQFIHAFQTIGVIEETMTTAWTRRMAFSFDFPGVV